MFQAISVKFTEAESFFNYKLLSLVLNQNILYLIIIKQIDFLHKNLSIMSSPSKLQTKLQYQIKKRINQSQLSKNDLEFYQRKIRRLQNQQNITQDELSKLKVKLRRAEDFQFKYELLFKQNTDLKDQIDSCNNQINDFRAINEQLKISLEEKAIKDQDYSLERTNLMCEIGKWKDKFQQLIEKSKRELEDERIRCQQTIKHESDKIKREFVEKQQDYTFEIRQLKKVIQEKQTVEDIIHARVQKIRNEKDEQIKRLGSIIERNKANHEQAIKQKNQQLEKIKDKFEKMINFDIQNLKNNLEDQQEIFGIQLNGLRQMIGLKNDQIQKLLNEVKRQAHDHQFNRKQLLKEITILKEKIYSVERDSEIQMNNMKQRLISIHTEDVKALESRHQKIESTLKGENQELQKFLQQKQRMIDNDRLEFERMKDEMHDRLNQKDKRITDLGQSLKSRGQLNASQMKNLHESFHKITSQKEDIETQYQKNITFLNLQINKLSASNELKIAQIKKLHEEIHHLKLSYEQHIRELQAKNRKERKEREQQRDIQRAQKDKMQQNVEDMERQYKNKQRRLERQKDKLQREINKTKYMLEQAQRDIGRLNKYIKQLDQSLKNQFKKNQLSTLDKDGLRRQILSELQKQKVELQALKMMEIDQIKKRYQIEFARLNGHNEQLQTDLLNKSISFQTLESEFKKLDHKNRNMDKLQKEKIKNYENKMMTLNQQINITQNLYKTFLEAKARAQNQ